MGSAQLGVVRLKAEDSAGASPARQLRRDWNPEEVGWFAAPPARIVCRLSRVLRRTGRYTAPENIP